MPTKKLEVILKRKGGKKGTSISSKKETKKQKQRQKQKQQQNVKVNVQSSGGGGGTSVPSTFRDTGGENAQITSLVNMVKQANAKAERDLEGIRREILRGEVPSVKERAKVVKDAGTAMENVVEAVFNAPDTNAKGIVERAVGDIEEDVRRKAEAYEKMLESKRQSEAKRRAKTKFVTEVAYPQARAEAMGNIPEPEEEPPMESGGLNFA